jgi:hypothetical protein
VACGDRAESEFFNQEKSAGHWRDRAEGVFNARGRKAYGTLRTAVSRPGRGRPNRIFRPREDDTMARRAQRAQGNRRRAEPEPKEKKMIVEERIYTLRPGTAAAYLQTYEKHGLPAQLPILGTLIGYYTTEFGPLNQVIHIWAYKDAADRAKRRAALAKSKEWQAYLPMNRDKIVTQENKLLTPAPFFDPATGPMRG